MEDKKRQSILRRLTNITMAVIGLLLLTGGTSWAVEFGAALDGSFPLQITQGATSSNAFAVRVTASGTFAAGKSGKLIVCNAVTLNSDGTTTCTGSTEVVIQNGNHNSLGQFPKDFHVSVTVAPDVACSQTYEMFVALELDLAQGGADFGEVNGVEIRNLNLPFQVQVGCAAELTEGCSLGYWKNHTSNWHTLDPYQTVGSVFPGANNAPYSLGGQTLHQALSFKGGSTLTGAAQILLRQAVAAVLNADHISVAYPRTFAEIVVDVNAALASQTRSNILSLAAALDGDNNLGCPLE